MSTRPATLAGLSVEVARRRLAREFREQDSIRPSSMRASWSAMRSASTTPRWWRSPTACWHRRRPTRSPRSPRAGSRASRWRASSATRNSGACRSSSTPRRWCRGRKPRPWSRPRWRRSTGEHRSARVLRIVDLGTGSGALLLALLSELPAAFGVGTDISVAALACARDNAAALGLAPVRRSSRATTAPRSTGRSISSSPIRPMSRATTSPTCSPRSASSIRAARSTAAPMGLMAIARSPPMPAACSRRTGCSWWNSGAGQADAVTAILAGAGLARTGTAARSCGHRPGARYAAGAMSLPHCRYEKKRLDCGSRPTRFRARN